MINFFGMDRLPLSLFLALRYLRPRRTFVSLITIISVMGVLLGVMVLILVISVMTGFDVELREKVLGLNSHLTITTYGTITHWEDTAQLIEKRPHVKGVSPFIVGPVLAKTGGKVLTPYIKGIDPKREEKVSNISKYITRGKFDLDGDKIIIGIEMARRYGIFIGDKVLIYSPKNLENKKVAYLPEELTVTGIFESGMFEYNLGFIFCSLETAQNLYELKDGVQGLAIMTDQLEVVDGVKRDLVKILKPPLKVNTWMELNRHLFSAIAVEKNMMFFLLIFIIIVAAFGIMSTLITVTVQKTREIGILKALGATPTNILTVFLAQGMIVGAIGTTCGLGLGLLLLRYRNEFLEFLRKMTGFELFPREIYNFNQLPALTSLQDVVIICSSAFLICTLAGFIPAWRAARLQSAAALRDF
jgi:lipoprotein-releasing system permease protein